MFRRPGLIVCTMLGALLVTGVLAWSRHTRDPGEGGGGSLAPECEAERCAVQPAIDLKCPCDGSLNRGKYTSCVGHVTRDQHVSKDCRTQIIHCAARSTCGRPGFVICDVRGRCEHRNSAAACQRVNGTVRPAPSCCPVCGGEPTTTTTSTTVTTTHATTTSTTTTTTTTASTSTTIPCMSLSGEEHVCIGECPQGMVCGVFGLGVCACGTPCAQTGAETCGGDCPPHSFCGFVNNQCACTD
jgi:hypothetical protein